MAKMVSWEEGRRDWRGGGVSHIHSPIPISLMGLINRTLFCSWVGRRQVMVGTGLLTPSRKGGAWEHPREDNRLWGELAA